MALIDLDELRAARQEAQARKKPPELVLKGRRYKLPPTYPLAAALAAEDLRAKEFLDALLADEDAVAQFITDADAEDLLALMSRVARAYGTDPGESAASSPSSASTGGRSRPTTSRTTAVTSSKTAGARGR
jgi:hypothetical protein